MKLAEKLALDVKSRVLTKLSAIVGRTPEPPMTEYPDEHPLSEEMTDPRKRVESYMQSSQKQNPTNMKDLDIL